LKQTNTTKNMGRHYHHHAHGTTNGGGFGLFLGMGIYACYTYQQLKGLVTDSQSADGTQCMGQTILNLLLASGIVELVSSFALLWAAIAAAYVGITIQKDLGEDWKFRIMEISAVSLVLLRVLSIIAVIGMSIAMSVLLWRDQCSYLFVDSSTGWFFQKMQTYLIIYWVLGAGIGTIVTMSLIGIATYLIVVKARG
jgi:hypothetical protein